MPNEKVIIIGAGLSGSLLAIYLAQRGIAVDVYEARGDMRRETVAAGRSINLALSNRGIRALREVGIWLWGERIYAQYGRNHNHRDRKYGPTGFGKKNYRTRA